MTGAAGGNEALQKLYRLAPRGVELGLERMAAACARFGHPERAFQAIHVAGTNGKGSIAAMVESIARAAGRRTGLYTSPHLCRFAERIRIAGEPIDDALLAPILDEVLSRAPELSFFEAATLTAFVAFARSDVELAVVEVGLGGRLDATNVLPSPPLPSLRATAIARIAFDHEDRLGHTLASIAREKAGILKRDVPAVLGPLEPEARAAIEAVASSVGAPIVPLADDEAARRLIFGPLGLDGAHQRDNAAVAVTLARIAGFDDGAIAAGLRDVRWPGRLESIATPKGPVLLDAAHNPDGAASLAKALAARGIAPSHVALLFGAMADKKWRAMLAMLAPLAAHRLFVAPGGRTPAAPAEMAAAFGGATAASVAEGLAAARRAVGTAGLVVVAGSIFLIGEARALLLGLERDPPVAL